jgi:predicted RNA-binding Zn-ribbon protein involved in translation (DUF1610 family)
MLPGFPPPDFIPTQSKIEGIEVYMPAPPDQERHRKIVEFACPQCGAATAYNAADGGLTCTHCGYHEPPHRAVVGRAAEQFEFTVETMQRAAQGWGDVRKELQCQNCGAYTSVPPDTLTHTCPFCSSNKVIQRQAPQDVMRPRFLIPFKFEADACHDLAQKWLGSSWMTPGALRRLSRMANFNGIYLPFWTFDAITMADWKAEVGHRKTEHYYSGGKRRTRTRIVWKWEAGQARLDIDDLLISGTTRLSPILLDRIKGYDLHDLAPYEPKYLAGFQAQAYDIPLEAAWERARHNMREQTRRACRSQASTSKIRNFSMTLEFGQERWRYMLLPAYIAVYRYNQQSYQVMINAQTGTVTGQRPVDWLKVWLAVAALLSPGLLLGLVGLGALLLGGLGIFIMMIGFVLLVIGLIISFNLVRQAQGMDDI